MTKETREVAAKAGDEMQLDCIYDLQGIIPNSCYHNINDKGEPCDCGDNVIFTNDVEIVVTINTK
jgi:hypothetical protein